ncbi:MAG: hypothetical protein LQ350_001954 [Teloschistes chrysophthalmus]|nr:MAG: hypothetical protein LQ350_001954 [Niorma chrysophthalma]
MDPTIITTFSSLDITSTTTTSNKPFRFFDLPAELRNIIYAEILTYNGIRPTFTFSLQKTPYTTTTTTTMTNTTTLNALTPHPTLTDILTGNNNNNAHSHHPNTPAQHPQDFLAVLLTCRAFYAEAKDVFWRQNRFLVRDGEERECFEKWLEKRGLRGVVRKIESLPAEGPDWVARYRVLRKAGLLGAFLLDEY